jgi:hypothetical protein
MYGYVLLAHGAWRWVVIFAGIAAVVAAVQRSRESGAGMSSWPYGKVFVTCLDIQVLIGAALFLLLSPLTSVGLPVAAQQLREVRFFSHYHVAAMVGAFLLAHIAAPVIRRAKTERSRHGRAALAYAVVLLIVLCATPWWRPLLRI